MQPVSKASGSGYAISTIYAYVKYRYDFWDQVAFDRSRFGPRADGGAHGRRGPLFAESGARTARAIKPGGYRKLWHRRSVQGGPPGRHRQNARLSEYARSCGLGGFSQSRPSVGYLDRIAGAQTNHPAGKSDTQAD